MSKCYRCFRPEKSCYCKYINPFDCGIKFVILMHPKEAFKQKTGTPLGVLVINNEIISEEDIIRAVAYLNNIYINDTGDCLIFLSALNLCNTYVKQNNSKIGYSFKKGIKYLIDTLNYRNILDIYINRNKNNGTLFIFQIGDIQFSFHDEKKTEINEKTEETLLYEWINTLPENYKTEMTALYDEMAKRETIEAKIYKAIDSLEALIQHNISDLSTWIPKEYELNKTYADDKVAFSEYLKELREEVRKDTLNKLGEIE